MAYKYAKTTAPFNFLGHFSESQKGAFKSWVTGHLAKFPDIQMHHQIRAQQLRKSAGVLEEYYAKFNDETLESRFEKEAWKPVNGEFFNYDFRDDHLPMVMMSRIKERFREQLQRQDDGVFYMNHLRHLIETHEDQAQYTQDFVDGNSKFNISQLLAQIENYFTRPEYQAVLVRDTSDTYENEPRFRVHQMDDPTAWEKFKLTRLPQKG